MLGKAPICSLPPLVSSPCSDNSLVCKALGPLGRLGLRGMLEPIVTSIVILRDKVRHPCFAGWHAAVEACFCILC